MSDGSLLILSSAYNPLVQIDFYNLFPKTISGIDFDSAVTAKSNVTILETAFNERPAH